MAEIKPLTALHYDLERAGPLQELLAPPYDVIDPDERERLAARSPYNVVHVDLPVGDPDPYAEAAQTLARWRDEGAVVLDTTTAVWGLTQDFTDPTGERRTRSGVLCAVRVEDYGAGRIRPHERTHPGPKEDRLRLTRATRANLSPIFALYDDPRGISWGELAAHTTGPPFGEATGDDGTVNRLWRIEHEEALDAVELALEGTELLIADGHHRYETARVYADEVGGEGHTAGCSCAWSRSRTPAWPSTRPTVSCAASTPRAWPTPSAATSTSRRSGAMRSCLAPPAPTAASSWATWTATSSARSA